MSPPALPLSVELPVEGLEDDAVALFARGGSIETTLALSTAISLKRLADAWHLAGYSATPDEPLVLTERAPLQ